ncbi:endoribonuclease L-PSP [Colletotrichum asianum]
MPHLTFPPTRVSAPRPSSPTLTTRPCGWIIKSGYRAKVRSGLDRQTTKLSPDVTTQVDQAFDNVDFVLKDAGGKGWEQVAVVMSYHIDLSDEAQEAMVRNFRRWMPNHKALWTAVGVKKLGDERMLVEIEVVAHDPVKK